MLWNGFEYYEFEFEGMAARVVLPKFRRQNPSLIVKTEYFDAFPETEIALVERGYYLCFIENKNRWGTDDDLDRKARFVRFIESRYALSSQCIPVGMSCGGLIAVKFAAKFPQFVSCLYLDAPVINYMSCPCGFGNGNSLGEDNSEIMNALGLNTIGELMAYRDMPLDKLPTLIENRIPVVMVAGDSDMTVPYDENGLFLERAYNGTGIDLEVFIKEGCDHHPHGLEDPTSVIDFIERHSC